MNIFFAHEVERAAKMLRGIKKKMAMIRYGIFFGEKNHLSPYNHLGSGPKKKWLKINIHFFLVKRLNFKIFGGLVIGFC